jgi:hypothetical protein
MRAALGFVTLPSPRGERQRLSGKGKIGGRQTNAAEEFYSTTAFADKVDAG